MTAVITSISPPRGRAGLTPVAITGSGLSAGAGQNDVTFFRVSPPASFPAVVVTDTATQVDVTIPAGIPTDEMLRVELTNLDDGTIATWWWWSKDLAASIAASRLPMKAPGVREIQSGLGNKDMSRAEAKFFERITAQLELIPFDILGANKGTLAAMASTGLRQVAAGALGETYTNSPSGGEFLVRRPVTLDWGLQIDAANVAATLMGAGAVDTDNTIFGTEDVVSFAGRLATVSVFCRASAVSRVAIAEVLVNGVVQATGSLRFGLGINGGQQDVFYPYLTVAAGDRIEIRLTKNNATTTWNGRAIAMVV